GRYRRWRVSSAATVARNRGEDESSGSRRGGLTGGQLRAGAFGKPQGGLHHGLLLLQVHFVGTGGGAGAGLPASVDQVSAGAARDLQFQELLAYEAPGPHVSRLFLGPHQCRRRRIAGEDAEEGVRRERVELLGT